MNGPTLGPRPSEVEAGAVLGRGDEPRSETIRRQQTSPMSAGVNARRSKPLNLGHDLAQ